MSSHQVLSQHTTEGEGGRNIPEVLNQDSWFVDLNRTPSHPKSKQPGRLVVRYAAVGNREGVGMTAPALVF